MSEFTGILAEIDNVIGAALTLKLVSECGGSTIYIPKKPTEKMPLCQLLGVENVKKLSLALGSGELLIPMSYFRGMGKKKSSDCANAGKRRQRFRDCQKDGRS